MTEEKPKESEPEKTEEETVQKKETQKVEEPQIDVQVIEPGEAHEKAVDNAEQVPEKKSNPFRPDEDNRSTIVF
jgi:hypothetical protein